MEKIAGPTPKRTRTPKPELYLGTITTGSGVRLDSLEGQTALARVLLGLPNPHPTSQQPESKKTG